MEPLDQRHDPGDLLRVLLRHPCQRSDNCIGKGRYQPAEQTRGKNAELAQIVHLGFLKISRAKNFPIFRCFEENVHKKRMPKKAVACHIPGSHTFGSLCPTAERASLAPCVQKKTWGSTPGTSLAGKGSKKNCEKGTFINFFILGGCQYLSKIQMNSGI